MTGSITIVGESDAGGVAVRVRSVRRATVWQIRTSKLRQYPRTHTLLYPPYFSHAHTLICTCNLHSNVATQQVSVRVYRKLVLLQASGYRWKLTTPLIVTMGICARVPTLNIYFTKCHSTAAKYKLQTHLTHEPFDLAFLYILMTVSRVLCGIIQLNTMLTCQCVFQ